jgi:hypothetical protein
VSEAGIASPVETLPLQTEVATIARVYATAPQVLASQIIQTVTLTEAEEEKLSAAVDDIFEANDLASLVFTVSTWPNH